MMTIHRMIDIPLEPGEVVVAMTQFQGELYAITDRGTLYRIQFGEYR